MHTLVPVPASTASVRAEVSANRKPGFAYRPEIDGLRALAVVAVIANHLHGPLMPSGFLGVDIFFAISGYVITGSLWRAEFASLGALLRAFYARRVRRLLPALLACVLLTGFAVSVVAVNPDPSLKTGVAAVFGVSNLRLLRWATDYFAEPTALNAFTHTWSLGVEEQFYVLFPLLLWFLWLARGTERRPRSLVASITVLSVASLVAFVALGGQSRPIAFFLMPTRFWELGAGCLLFVVTERYGRLRADTTRLAGAATLGLLLTVVAVLFAPPSRASAWTIVAVAGTTLLIGRLRPDTLAHRVLSSRPARAIGTTSYSLYLWHWSVFSISRWTVGISAHIAPLELLLVVVLAVASYHFIEKPLRAARWGATTGRTLLYGGMASVAAAAVLVALRVPLREPLQAVGDRIVPRTYADPGILQKSLPCHLPARIDDAYQRCMARPAPADRVIFVIGDSHATNHVPSIERAVQGAPDVRVGYLVEPGYVNALTGVDSCLGFEACIDRGFDVMLRFLADSLQSSDVVVFSWSRDRVTVAGELPRAVDDAALARLRTQLLRLRASVRRAGASMVLVEDTPKLCDHVLYAVDILRQGRLDRCNVPADVSRRDRAGLSRIYRELEAPDVRLFDPHDALCAAGRCGMTLPGSSDLLYGDSGGHFTPRYGAVLAAEWRSFLRSAGLPRPTAASALD